MTCALSSSGSWGQERGQQGSLHFPVPSVLWQQQMAMVAGSEVLTSWYGRGCGPTDEWLLFAVEKSTDVARDGLNLCKQGGCSKT